MQRALEDSRATPAKVARVIGIDAALAVRVLQLANSAFLNPSSKPITELQQAVNRLGHQLVRCTAVSFALQQMTNSCEAALRPQLHELWRQGTLVASIAYVLARETGAANPDEALVAGLMHNIGSLYIITARPPARCDLWRRRCRHAAAQPGPSANCSRDPRSLEIRTGHRFRGQQPKRAQSTGAGEAARLTEVLIAAIALVPCVFYRELLDETVTASAPFQRLALDAAACERLLKTTAQQIKVVAQRAGRLSGFAAIVRGLVHKRLLLDLARLLVALLGAQCVGQQPPSLRLSAAIATGERQRLATANLCLMRVALNEPQLSELDPQQRVIWFDAQRPIEC